MHWKTVLVLLVFAQTVSGMYLRPPNARGGDDMKSTSATTSIGGRGENPRRRRG